ncbi:hypothetical protein JJO26_06080 [Listeria monocytogenes]|nr:hypothetical protein [Listeria monocytogenes]EKN1188233.1 hypothetical protein [Listeria monocytogenes]MCE8344612.1 hypothetical protein [Listeria monocytogenes]MCE8353613.1 hypothetical protein [Listeria monocytogenes]HAM1162911.1 hypothetical protein [Listeria monocytogenes]
MEEVSESLIVGIISTGLAILALMVAYRTLESTDLPRLRITSSKQKMSWKKTEDNQVQIIIENKGNDPVCQLFLFLVVKSNDYKYNGWCSIKEKQYFLSKPVFDLKEKDTIEIIIEYKIEPDKSIELDYFVIVQDYNGSKYKMDIKKGDKHNKQFENWSIPIKKIHFYNFYWLIKYRWFQKQAKKQKNTFLVSRTEELTRSYTNLKENGTF